jgi:hypothetical protein
MNYEERCAANAAAAEARLHPDVREANRLEELALARRAAEVAEAEREKIEKAAAEKARTDVGLARLVAAVEDAPAMLQVERQATLLFMLMTHKEREALALADGEMHRRLCMEADSRGLVIR